LLGKRILISRRVTYNMCMPSFGQAKGGVVDMHIYDERGLIALQGPKAAAALQVRN